MFYCTLRSASTSSLLPRSEAFAEHAKGKKGKSTALQRWNRRHEKRDRANCRMSGGVLVDGQCRHDVAYGHHRRQSSHRRRGPPGYRAYGPPPPEVSAGGGAVTEYGLDHGECEYRGGEYRYDTGGCTFYDTAFDDALRKRAMGG